VHTVVINDYAWLITSWLLWRPMDRYAACVKNNNK
jgi:DICT domain-containing protein